MQDLIVKKAKTLFFPTIGREISVSKIDLPPCRSPYFRYVEDGFVLETHLYRAFCLPEFSYVILLDFQRDINSFDLQKLRSLVVSRIRNDMRISSFVFKYIVVSVSRKDSYLISNIHQEIRKGA
jgi:hypothetical protein